VSGERYRTEGHISGCTEPFHEGTMILLETCSCKLVTQNVHIRPYNFCFPASQCQSFNASIQQNICKLSVHVTVHLILLKTTLLECGVMQEGTQYYKLQIQGVWDKDNMIL
jgi:hypothetical protein